MGRVCVEAQWSKPRSRNGKTMACLMDTGADTSNIPPAIAKELGLKPFYQEPRRLADGSIIKVDIVNVVVQIGKRKTAELATVMGGECLLGLNALERLGFRVDPVRRRLLPVPPARL